ncbi:Exportin-7 [Acropora cervicornis]|uniref:Exportin-7 n=1 Tax=Acropora cervicornis TaxID=6130 RepID=A0AAD9VFW2_ACRCE|nr:Exportin-7 [Acropora cervicornis]
MSPASCSKRGSLPPAKKDIQIIEPSYDDVISELSLCACNVRLTTSGSKTSMEEQEIAQLDLLCKQLYEATDTATRNAAERALSTFTNSPDCLTKCQYVLERGNSSYSQLIAASSLTRLISKNTTISVEQRLHMRNYVLTYLGTRPNLASYVSQSLIQFLARLTKLSWFDVQKNEFVFRTIVDDVGKFLQGSVDHCIIGVHVLSQLVCEMNQGDSTRSLTKHRKIASSFRDLSLFNIFNLSITLLREHSLMSHLLQLTCSCLSFDFIGTSMDESSDDLGTVQIPTNWRGAFLNFATLQLFFDLYRALPTSLSPMALSCLVQLASIRRSLFNNTERAKFLEQLVLGVKGILESPQSLADPNNYHEFCRLLARLKSNYQLGEIVKVEVYRDFIALIAKFTVTSLQMWQFAPNSLHYLLSLWQRMVASMPYVKNTEPHLLESYVPEVTKAYVTSRLASVEAVIRDNVEDPLDDTGTVQQQLDQLSTFGRCEYEKTCQLLISLFDQAAQSYQELVQSTSASTNDMAIQEGRLTWLVCIIGSVIGGRVSYSTIDEYDALDGELLMNLTDSQLSQRGSEKLELSILSFFEQFRKMYVGDQAQKTSKVYRRLSERLGLHDESNVLSVFMGKIITNMKFWGSSEAIISKTLQLLTVPSEHFPFLGIHASRPYKDMRSRTTFYIALGRLLMVDLGEDEDKFETFMTPITVAMDSVASRLVSAERNAFQLEETKRTLVGLCRDIRGLSFAFSKSSYMMLFDWIYPTYTSVLLRAIEWWYHDPNVSTPVLKLMAELVQNRSQRLHFDVSSPNGILLFRVTSEMIVALKGISICFSMLKAALCGGYVNFGVFSLYGDDTLEKALKTFVELLSSIPHSNLLEYPKLSQSYYALLEILAQDHMNFLSSLEPRVFIYILSSILEGLTALDIMVCTGCCGTLDFIVTHLFKTLSKRRKKNLPALDQQPPCLRILESHPEMIQQWSMSRPLLGLILLNEKYFQELQRNVIAMQPVEKQEDMAQCFRNLMEGVEPSLITKNRDRFTQNLSIFRREVNNSLKASSNGTSVLKPDGGIDMVA